MAGLSGFLRAVADCDARHVGNFVPLRIRIQRGGQMPKIEIRASRGHIHHKQEETPEFEALEPIHGLVTFFKLSAISSAEEARGSDFSTPQNWFVSKTSL